jgi:DNA-binding Xre family transcriptional regulator|tara:strand:+ start:274 stop:483 length:210 start_codon:yes stop_codon:yes gene_type:complete
MELIDTGRCLIAAQRSKGVNSRQLAKIAKTSPQQVLRWRKSKNMKIHTIQLLCLSLDISITDFISFGYK